jgi:phosphopantothenate-cysteine ligase
MLMNILITAGGNVEKIDEVRSIRNTGTGRLGALIAEELLKAEGRHNIFYVSDPQAVTPQTGGFTAVPAGNVTELETTIQELCAQHRFDAIVHSMAVSDYRVKNVTTAINAAKAAVQRTCTANPEVPTPEELADSITNAQPVNEQGKISSDHNDILVVLERAPKIISTLRGLAPNAIIVGFKLLAGVSEEELVRVGYDLLKKNDCNYVLANDMKYLDRGKHIGHLIDRNGSYTTHNSKEEIAKAITKKLLSI